jgi:hypothetical protein
VSTAGIISDIRIREQWQARAIFGASSLEGLRGRSLLLGSAPLAGGCSMRTRKRTGTTLAVLLAALAWSSASSTALAQTADSGAPTTITWNGIDWNVKSRQSLNPGPNAWSPSNVFVDANGDLHLAITNVGGTWYCAEVWTNATFPFGTFQWQVKSAVDQFDPNVVLGMFIYGPTALGPDGTHEFDIEYARFGSATGDNGWWTVYPNVQVNPPLLGRSHYPLVLGADPTTTSRFTWAPTNVAFSTLQGYQAIGSTSNLINSWTYQPTDPTMAISQSPMPVHMNLWLRQGMPPINGQGAEVVIHGFSFSPSGAAPLPPPPSAPALPGNGAGFLAACLIACGLLWAARKVGETRLVG